MKHDNKSVQMCLNLLQDVKSTLKKCLPTDYIVSCSACLNTVHNKKTLNCLFGETCAETLLAFSLRMCAYN